MCQIHYDKEIIFLPWAEYDSSRSLMRDQCCDHCATEDDESMKNLLADDIKVPAGFTLEKEKE